MFHWQYNYRNWRGEGNDKVVKRLVENDLYVKPEKYK